MRKVRIVAASQRCSILFPLQRDKKLEEAREKRSSKNTIKIAAQLQNQKVTNS
jgi:hypothetical protein